MVRGIGVAACFVRIQMFSKKNMLIIPSVGKDARRSTVSFNTTAADAIIPAGGCCLWGH